MSVFHIEQNDELNHFFILRISERWANFESFNGWSLSNARKVALVSDDEMRKTFAHLAEVPEQGLLLSVLSNGDRVWEPLPFAEYFGSDFAYSYADLRNDSLLVVGTRRLPLGRETCIVLFHRIRHQRADWDVSCLDGSSARMDRNGTFVLTWDSVGSNVKETVHRVCIYRTARDSSSAPGQAAPKTKDPLISIALEAYDALVGSMLIDARMLLPTSGSHLCSANDVPHSAKILLFCARQCSETATVFVMDLGNQTIEFRLEMQMPWSTIASTPVARFLDSGNVAITQDEQKIFICESDGRHGAVHDLRDGRMICKVLLSSQDRTRAVEAKFDQTGQFIAVNNGAAIEVFRVGLPIERLDGTEHTEKTTEAILSVLRSMEKYDNIAFGQLMAEGFTLKSQIMAEMAPLVEAGVFTGHRHTLSDYEGSNVTHLILSPDTQFVATVLREECCRICIYQIKKPQHFDSSCDTRWKMVTTAEVAAPRSSDDTSCGIFYSTNGQTEFAFASPQHEGILIARVRFKRPQDHITHWIESRVGVPLKRMKVTADGAKAIVVFEDGEFAVLNLRNGFRIVNRGHLHYPCGTDYFTESFIQAFPIHLSMDDTKLTVGFDPLKKKPISFRLNSSREDMTAEYMSNIPRFLRHDIEAILWTNRNQTRAVVGFRVNEGPRLVVYDISQTPAKELYDTSSVSSPDQIPKLNTQFSAHLGSRRDRDVLSETKRLPIVCMHFLLDLQHSVPDAALIDLLGIEIDTVIVKRLIFEHGCSVLARGREGKKNLFHHVVMNKKFDCAKLLLDLAAEKGKSLSFCWEDGDLLGWSVVHKSKEVAAFVMDLIAERCTTVIETAAILSVHTDKLLEVFPQLLRDYVVEDKLLYEYGRFSVPVSLLKSWEEKPVAMVTDPMANWTATDSEEVKSFWLGHCKALKKSIQKKREEVHVMAVSKFFCLEDIVDRRKGCLLANLMQKKVPVEIFGSAFVKSLVQWRWHSSLRNTFLFSALLHVIATISFSVCVVKAITHENRRLILRIKTENYASYTSEEDDPPEAQYFAFLCLSIIFYLNIFGVIPQIRILSFFIEPLVLYELIFGGDHDANKEDSILAALACMSCWISVVLYLQPLSATGPLVSTIKYVFLDIMPFTLLATLTIVGFGFSFMILFADVFYVNDNGYFSNPFRSFETLFHASLGQFEPEILQDSDEFLHVFRSLFFSAFLFVCGIVMLSLLIAILGDTYDRMKFIEKAEIIKCRANLIVVGNGWNGIPGKIWKACIRTMWRSRFPDPVLEHPLIMRHASDILVKPRKKCFHILVPAETIDSEKVDSWQGKILEVVKKFRSELEKNEGRLVEQINATRNEVINATRNEVINATRKEVEDLRKQMTKLVENLSSQAA